MKAPTNILLHRGRTAYALSAIYVGDDENGIHVWEIVGDIAPLPGDKITVEELPAGTLIRFPAGDL